MQNYVLIVQRPNIIIQLEWVFFTECFIEDGGILTGLFQAVKLRNSQGNTDMYVDGGLLCNYPVHVYDGMYVCCL